MERTPLSDPPSEAPREEPSIDKLYAYEPDRTCPERERIISRALTGPYGGYLAQTRERAERLERPARHNAFSAKT